MNNKYKIIGAIVAIVLVIIVTLSFSGKAKVFGSQVQNDIFAFTGGVQFNQNGVSTATQLNNLIFGTCTLSGVATIASSSNFGTATNVNCPITGETSGDTVLVTLATTTPGIFLGSAYASTTAGYATVVVNAGSGMTTTSLSALGLKVNYVDIR